MARIRSSARGKPAAGGAVASDVNFPHFWKQLRAAGWTYKKPTGLTTEGRYVSPDGSSVFVGEGALVAHAVQTGLLDSSDGSEDALGPPAATPMLKKSTRASPAATSAFPSVLRTPTAAPTPKQFTRASPSAPSASSTATATSKKPARASAAAASASTADPRTPTPAPTPKKTTRASAATASASAADPRTPSTPMITRIATSTPSTAGASPGSPSGTRSATGTSTGAVAPPSAQGADDVSLSQIDATVALSHGTLNALFDSPSAPAVLSQAAVPWAFDLSPSDISDASKQQAAAGLQLLSKASSVDSGGSAHESEEDNEEGQKTADPAGRTLRPRTRVRVKQDVNVAASDEDAGDYKSFGSGSDGEDAVADDEEPERGVDEDEDDVLSDADADVLDESFIESLMIGPAELRGAAKKNQEEALSKTKWTRAMSSFEIGDTPYPGLSDAEAVPTAELCTIAHSPLLTFFYFLPKSVWVAITAEANRYALKQLDRRAQALHAKQRAAGRTETLKQIRRRLKKKRGYEPHEILHVIGLLVARMLCPQKRRFADHWSLVEDGAVPSGSFGCFMGRNRCQDILRDLHFVDNEAERTRDKLWKLRPVVEKLQQRFLAGWSLPPVFSFDEGVLPATSKRNSTRMFIPDKPKRYGSKMLITCDPRTAYYHRFEVYTGKRASGDQGSSFDHKTGAAAVVRNLKVVMETKRLPWHAVVIDRYYSSVLLVVELLKMNVYVIGTIMTNRRDYDDQVKDGRKTRPASIPRGSLTCSRSVQIPTIVAFHWRDRKPVHYLCTGAVITDSSVGGKIKGVGAITVPCPMTVSDYHRLMGGVDVHDQLRLQKYSLQTSTRFQKFYKNLFSSLLDLAMVMALLAHKEAARMGGATAMARGEWFCVLQNQLLQLKSQDFAGVEATPPITGKTRRRAAVPHTHAPQQSEDWVVVSVTQKRRQRSCKVCALLREDASKKSYATTFYCERCSLDNAKLWLCNKIRREYNGVQTTCFDIWHEEFDAEDAIPRTLGKLVVLCRSGAKADARAKTRRELQLRADGGETGSESDDEDSDFERVAFLVMHVRVSPMVS